MTHILLRNDKIGNTSNISLPPVISCKNSDNCRDDCYAVKFYKMYPSVKMAWDENYDEACNRREVYFRSVRKHLLWYQPRYFRWHVSGDILDQDYLERMKGIAADYGCMKFLVFTKRFDLEFKDIPGNLQVVFSAWKGMEPPSIGIPVAYVRFDPEEEFKNSLECINDCEACRVCWRIGEIGKNVVLHKH